MALLTQNELVGIKQIKKVKRDQPTDQPMDKAGCRVACTRLKIDKTLRITSLGTGNHPCKNSIILYIHMPYYAVKKGFRKHKHTVVHARITHAHSRAHTQTHILDTHTRTHSRA